MTTDIKCPECKDGTLVIVTDGQVGVPYSPKVHYVNGEDRSDVVWVMENKRFAACNRCEFCHQF